MFEPCLNHVNNNAFSLPEGSLIVNGEACETPPAVPSTDLHGKPLASNLLGQDVTPFIMIH